MSLESLLGRKDIPKELKRVIKNYLGKYEELEKKIIQLEDFNNQLLNNISDRLIFHEPDLRVLWVNKAAADSINMKPDEVVGKYCYELWHQRKEPCISCPVELARETGKPHETEVRDPNGRWVHIRGYPFYDEEGNLTGLLELSLDITKRKEAEMNLTEVHRQQNRFYAMLSHFMYNDLQKIVFNAENIELSHKHFGKFDLDRVMNIVNVAYDSAETIENVNRIFEVFKKSKYLEYRPTNLLAILDSVIEEFPENKFKYDIDKYSLDITITSDYFICHLFKAIIKFFLSKKKDENDLIIKIYGYKTDTEFTISLSDQISDPISSEVCKILSEDISDNWTHQGHYTGIALGSVIMRFYNGCLEIKNSESKGNAFLLKFPTSLFEGN